MINRSIEIFESLPTMFLIIALMAVVKPSLYYIVLIIGLTSWPPIARYTRNELLRIRKLEYIEAAHALGFGNARIIFKHALPNAINPILIALAFGVAGAIIAESTLSFLGIGISTDQVTWGSLLASARQSPEAWWLIVFPGLMIFMVVLSLNKLGDGLVRQMDNRVGA
jgi:peptide/nickel transport system permease protein